MGNADPGNADTRNAEKGKAERSICPARWGLPGSVALRRAGGWGITGAIVPSTGRPP